jgi:hypothetical protein
MSRRPWGALQSYALEFKRTRRAVESLQKRRVRQEQTRSKRKEVVIEPRSIIDEADRDYAITGQQLDDADADALMFGQVLILGNPRFGERLIGLN